MSFRFSCKDCTERHVGCHSTCEKYISEKAENDRLREEEHHKRKDMSTNSNGTYFCGKSGHHKHLHYKEE